MQRCQADKMDKMSMHFEKNYFNYLNYSQKEQMIKRHVLESLKWASKVLNRNLLNGTGRRALDVGCAFGYGVSLINSLGYDALGTDISSYGLTRGKERLGESVFVVCDAQENLPFKGKFDLVTCFEVLEHLKNPLSAVQNMYESCKDVLLCTTPNKTTERIFKRMSRGFDKTHINVKTPSEWSEQIRSRITCSFMRVDCFADSNFKVANALLFKSFKVPFGMETRIIVKK